MDTLSSILTALKEERNRKTFHATIYVLAKRLGGASMKKPLWIPQEELDAGIAALKKVASGYITRPGKNDDGIEIAFFDPEKIRDKETERWQHANDKPTKKKKRA